MLRRLADAIRAREDAHVIGALMAVSAWGIGPLFNKSMSVSAPTIAFYRFVVGIPVMWGAAFLAKATPSRRVLKEAMLPAVLFALSMIAGFTAIKETSVANATLVTSLQPVLVMFVAPKMFGEKLRVSQVLLAITAVAGVLLVVLSGASTNGANVKGDLFALSNVLLWTAYFLLAKRTRNSGTSSWSFLASVFFWSLFIVGPWAMTVSSDLGGMRDRDWVLIVLMALVPGAIGHGLMTWSQQRLDATASSLIILLSPVVSTVGAWVVFGEALGWGQIAGAVVLLVALSGFARVTTSAGPAAGVAIPEDPLLS